MAGGQNGNAKLYAAAALVHESHFRVFTFRFSARPSRERERASERAREKERTSKREKEREREREDENEGARRKEIERGG